MFVYIKKVQRDGTTNILVSLFETLFPHYALSVCERNELIKTKTHSHVNVNEFFLVTACVKYAIFMIEGEYLGTFTLNT